jgi:hypothetical protein
MDLGNFYYGLMIIEKAENVKKSRGFRVWKPSGIIILWKTAMR